MFLVVFYVIVHVLDAVFYKVDRALAFPVTAYPVLSGPLITHELNTLK